MIEIPRDLRKENTKEKLQLELYKPSSTFSLASSLRLSLGDDLRIQESKLFLTMHFLILLNAQRNVPSP